MSENSQSPDIGSKPPIVPKSIPKELLHQEFQWVLRCLEQRYGAALHVNVTDNTWVEISVESIPAVILAEQLHSERKSLFGTAEPRMQVITPQRPTGNEICLHLLTEPAWGVGRFSRFK